MKSAWLTEQAQDLQTKGKHAVIAEMTEKQAVNLNLLAYKAGYSSPKEMLETMIGDLTGWGETSPCQESMRKWYEDAHQKTLETYYFRFYLYNYDYNMEHLNDMLTDMGQFEEDYQNYLDESDGMITEPWERCLEVAREIYKEGGFN